MNWSKYQTAIYEAFEQGRESLLIEAVAGSGKTTVLVELAAIMQRAFPEQRAVFVAFNRSIADELARRISASNVRAMTLHSAGWSAWRRAGGLYWEPRVKNDKVSVIMREVLSYEENKRFGETTRKLVGYAKGAGLIPSPCYSDGSGYQGLIPDTPESWEGLIDHYGLDEDTCNVELARRVLYRSIELGKESCDFADMLLMPLVSGVPFDQYDVVLCDEGQDLGAIEHELVGRMKKPDGRVIVVADRNQSIYGFKGSLCDSVDRFKERFNMRELPLSISYRCPVAVVEHARQWVPQIEAREDAPWGYVGLEGTDWAGQTEVALGAPCCTCPEYAGACECLSPDYRAEGITKWRGISDFRPGDAILCRLTRPVVAAAFALIRRRVACHVLGRDIGKGLVDLVRRVIKKARLAEDSRLGAFAEALGEWMGDQRYRLTAKRKMAELGRLEDQVMTVMVFMEELERPEGEEEERVPRLIAEIERLFVDNGGGQQSMVTLATVHKSKGLQWPRVFILDAGELMPCRWARQRWELSQELNIQYVAATRAMHELRYIKSSDLGVGL